MKAALLGILFCCSLYASPLQIDLGAKSAILVNADTGAVLFEKEPHLQLSPASTTKMATALYLLETEKYEQDRIAVVSADCVRQKTGQNAPTWWVDRSASMAGLKSGERLSLEELFYGMMIPSGCDAANVLAEAASGSVATFMEELNAYLASIGCRETHFCNPHGLPCDGHVSTASDLSLIAQRAMRYPEFREVVAQTSWTKRATNKQPETEFRQTNQLLRPGRYFYDKAIGIKTGNGNGKHLVAAAEQDGRTLIAVLLGYEKGEDLYLDTKRLFEKAFNESKCHRILFTGKESYSRKLLGAKKDLQAILPTEVAIDYYPAEEPELRANIHWDVVSLPIKKGAKVGEIRVTDAKGASLQTAPLFAKEEVEGKLFFMLKEKIMGFFK